MYTHTKRQPKITHNVFHLAARKKNFSRVFTRPSQMTFFYATHSGGTGTTSDTVISFFGAQTPFLNAPVAATCLCVK